jgi:hypothetical protein
LTLDIDINSLFRDSVNVFQDVDTQDLFGSEHSEEEGEEDKEKLLSKSKDSIE